MLHTKKNKYFKIERVLGGKWLGAGGGGMNWEIDIYTLICIK